MGEESRSAIRGLGARLRSLRRVAGVDMVTFSSMLVERLSQRIVTWWCCDGEDIESAHNAQCIDLLTKPNAALGVSHTSESIGGTYRKYTKYYCPAPAQDDVG